MKSGSGSERLAAKRRKIDIIGGVANEEKMNDSVIPIPSADYQRSLLTFSSRLLLFIRSVIPIMSFPLFSNDADDA